MTSNTVITNKREVVIIEPLVIIFMDLKTLEEFMIAIKAY